MAEATTFKTDKATVPDTDLIQRNTVDDYIRGLYLDNQSSDAEVEEESPYPLKLAYVISSQHLKLIHIFFKIMKKNNKERIADALD